MQQTIQRKIVARIVLSKRREGAKDSAVSAVGAVSVFLTNLTDAVLMLGVTPAVSITEVAHRRLVYP